MDAKPHRPLRTLPVFGFGNENQAPGHERHKSVGDLKTMASTGGLNIAAKRTVFGDVSNTAKAFVDIGLKDQVKDRVATLREKTISEKENVPYNRDAFLRPAQRPLNPSKAALPATSSTSNAVVPQALGPIEVARNHAVIKNSVPARATIVFSDQIGVHHGLKPELAYSYDAVAPAVLNPVKNPRHHKSQPNLRLEQPILRRTKSRHLPKFDEVFDFDDATEAPYQDAVEELPKIVEEAPQYDEVEALNHRDDSRSVTAENNSQKAPLAPAPETSRDSWVVPALSESEEYYWDEDEEEDFYDDQGYTTAHSYRSNGENTTGGVTTMEAPRVTAKVRRELEVAKAIVESNRTDDDLDEEAWDVSMVAEYGDEIFEYMKHLESKMLPNKHYMEIQTEIQWSMRSVLMDWLVQVHHRFALLPETLFLTVNYIDRFLSVKIVSLGKLQLVGATAIFVAAKYEEINCPSVQEIVYMVDQSFSVEEILKAERFMLSMLQFELGWPGPMSFLRRISKADDYDLETRTLAKYFLEVTIMDERFVATPPSFLAAGAHCLARLMLKKGDWTTGHVHYSGYTMNQLKPLVSMLLGCCQDPHSHHAAVYEKYAGGKYKRASTFVETEIAKGFTLPIYASTATRLSTRSLHDDNSFMVQCTTRDAAFLVPIEG